MKTILFMIIAYFIGAIPSGVWMEAEHIRV